MGVEENFKSLSINEEENKNPNPNVKEDEEEEPEEGEIVGEEDDTSSSSSKKGVVEQPHPLEHSWTFYFDNPSAKSKQATWGSSMRPIYTFATVEQFWRLLSLLLSLSFFFFFNFLFKGCEFYHLWWVSLILLCLLFLS